MTQREKIYRELTLAELAEHYGYIGQLPPKNYGELLDRYFPLPKHLEKKWTQDRESDNWKYCPRRYEELLDRGVAKADLDQHRLFPQGKEPVIPPAYAEVI